MMPVTDSYYLIGKSHRVCEDYALHVSMDDFSYVIVCDGCSSSTHTDVGARLLAHIASNALQFLYKRNKFNDSVFQKEQFPKVFSELVIAKCNEIYRSMSLPLGAFDTTLIVGITVGQTFTAVFWSGDGNVYLKHRDGSATLYTVNYESNAPYYLSYQIAFDKGEAYLREYGLSKTNLMKISKKEGTILEKSSTQRNAVSDPNYLILNDENIESLTVCSDGAGSYEIVEPYEKMTVMAILDEATAYKNPVGEFVRRRITRMETDHVKRGIVHQDDVSYACIYFG